MPTPVSDSVMTGPPGAASLLYSPPSWVERLSSSAMFSSPNPIEVELGSGDGSFLAQWARLSPDCNFIGVERLLGRLRKLDRRARRDGLSNLRLVRIEASYFLEFLLPARSIQALHVYFPDPWPKRKHRRKRLVNSGFTELAARALIGSGVVYLRTDDADYFAQMQEVFGADSRFVACETAGALLGIVTDFERDFHAQGVPTKHAAYRLEIRGK